MASRPDTFPITAAQLSANFCETLFYGIYLATCALCARTLLLTGSGREERWIRSDEIRWKMLIIAIALFIVCTFDVSLGLYHNFRAFIHSTDAESVFVDITSWINITRIVNQAVAMIIGDFVLVYRCWIVCGRRWLIITPSLVLYLANLAVIGRFFEIVASLRGESSRVTLVASQFQPWELAIFGTTAVLNILTTGILVWRIWSVEKESNRQESAIRPPLRLRKVIRVIAESGAAYTMSVFVTFVVSAVNSNALYPTSTMAIQMTGIAFNLILIRASPSRDQQFTEFAYRKGTAAHDLTNGSSTLEGSVIIFSQRNTFRDIELAGPEPERNPNERPSRFDISPEGENGISKTATKS